MPKAKEETQRVPPVPIGRMKKLSNPDVYEARGRYACGETKTALADEFEVSIPTISDAIHGLGAYAGV
jgi:hypothetical protein